MRLCPHRSTAAATGLVEQHLPLVEVLVVERLRQVPAHIRRDELMSAGMMALVLSAAAYDPERGVPFQKFAAFRIRGALIDELRAMDWASRSVRTRAREVDTVRTQLTTTLDRAPRTQEIANALGISFRQVNTVGANVTRGTVLSLQSLAANPLPETPANQQDGPEAVLLHREQMGYLHDAIAALPARLRFIVVAYYFGHRQMSEIAADMSITQSRVSQMCTEATAMIRDGMNSQLDPEAVLPSPRTTSSAAARKAYYQAIADRSTVARRLDMSTPRGEIRRDVYSTHVSETINSRIA